MSACYFAQWQPNSQRMPKKVIFEWKKCKYPAMIKISGCHFQTEKSILMNIRSSFRGESKCLRHSGGKWKGGERSVTNYAGSGCINYILYSF